MAPCIYLESNVDIEDIHTKNKKKDNYELTEPIVWAPVRSMGFCPKYGLLAEWVPIPFQNLDSFRCFVLLSEVWASVWSFGLLFEVFAPFRNDGNCPKFGLFFRSMCSYPCSKFGLLPMFCVPVRSLCSCSKFGLLFEVLASVRSLVFCSKLGLLSEVWAPVRSLGSCWSVGLLSEVRAPVRSFCSLQNLGLLSELLASFRSLVHRPKLGLLSVVQKASSLMVLRDYMQTWPADNQKQTLVGLLPTGH